MTTLKQGSSSAEVAQLTYGLYTLGLLEHYDVQPEYDERVVEAVRQFQTVYLHIVPTGECDTETLRIVEHYAGNGPPNGGGALVPHRPIRDAPWTGRPDGITRAGETAEFSTGAEVLLEGPLIELMRVSAVSLGWTVAIGLEGSATPIPGDGYGAGVGIYVAPDGDVGLYLSAQNDMGLLDGISGTIRSTAVMGGPENLKGFSYAVSAEGFYGVGAGVSVLFGEHGDFQGLATKVGIGVEFGIYVGLSYTKLHFEG